ncbi:MAG: hypothetical protein QMC00_00270 [Pseudomonadales bacterium]|jgi:hypothetical protein|nr:hypothetical protein [Gammaproteobacteria bacterium]|tara:strand:+ start:12486 stop:13292 length:807 start_codon:yes stop_codon:yes gene_type:complete
MVTTEDLLSLKQQMSAKQLSGEVDYHRLWISQLDCSWSAEQTAFAGGLISDRLAFLFISGYQAAVRRTFNLTKPTWTVLAISEDRNPDQPRPGLTESNDRVSGYKTWVASSRFAEDIIVSVDTTKLYIANRTTPGLQLVHKEAPGFLGDMSQGVAQFTDVAISELQVLGEFDLKLFAKREPLYIYFAFCGFLHRRGTADIKSLLEDLLIIASGDFTDPIHKALFAKTDTRISEIFSNLAPALFAGDYEKDKGLMSLYSKVIQKRAGLG